MKNIITLAFIMVFAAACGSESDQAPPVIDLTPDLGEMDANESHEEIGTIGDDLGGGEDIEALCYDEVSDAWPFINSVSGELVNTSQTAGEFTGTVGARAGGSMQASSNPFTYLNLATGEKVEITDVQSVQSSDWHIAFKRVAIRVNSAFSGPGEVAVAKVSNTSFAGVNDASGAGNYYEDETGDPLTCQIASDPIGQPITAFNLLNPTSPSGSWYSYGGMGSGRDSAS